MVVNCNFHSFGCTIDVIRRFGSAVSEVFLLNNIVIFDFEILSTSNGSTKRHMCICVQMNIYVCCDTPRTIRHLFAPKMSA